MCRYSAATSAIVRPIAVVQPPLHPLFGYHLAVVRLPLDCSQPLFGPLLLSFGRHFEEDEVEDDGDGDGDDEEEC